MWACRKEILPESDPSFPSRCTLDPIASWYLFNTGRRMNKTLVDGYTGERELMPAKNQMDGVHIRFDIGRSEAQLLSSSLTRRFVGLIRRTGHPPDAPFQARCVSIPFRNGEK